MKLISLIVLFIMSILAQIFFLESWQVVGVTANIVLAFLVVTCLFIPLEQILWFGLIGGLMFDFYNNADFGFNMGFYILVIIVAKYLLKFGENEYSWWKPALFASLAALVQAMLLRFSSIFLNFSWGVVWQVLAYGILTGLAAIVWYLVIGQVVELTDKINFRGIIRSK